jgi:hypothetical protein
MYSGLVPGEGIELTLLSKLDFEKAAHTFPFKNQRITSDVRSLTRSLQNPTQTEER